MINYHIDEYCIQQLSKTDGIDIYNMLKRIGREENHFQNPVHDMNYEQYVEWLKEQDDWAHGRNLPKGYSGQTSFWMYVNTTPVAFGKIRHTLNEKSRNIGGNIGYAVDPFHRGKGYATIFLRELIAIADQMGISEKLLTVEKFNYASKRVIEKNGGFVFKENDFRWYFYIKE